MDSQRRSTIVGLTLIGLPVGAMALGSVLPAGQEMRRNLYPDRAACERDYSPAQCEARATSSGGSSGSGGWHGPYYYGNRAISEARSDPGAGRTGQITRTETSTRGGFGAFGRAMRAVG
jgi:uncharacterized protein YgiB involved in biofilm formation